MKTKKLSRYLLAFSTLFLLMSLCLLVLYAVLTFSPARHFHCCQPSGLSFAEASAVALLLPLLLALAGIFGWTSLRTGQLPATLLHLIALLLLAVTSLLLGVGFFAGQEAALRVVERNFQLVRDCRTDWLVDQLQTSLNCSGWNLTTAHRSVCSSTDGPANVSTSATRPQLPASGPCREAVTSLASKAAGAAFACGLLLAIVALGNLTCQCVYQWRISDPEQRRQLNQLQLEHRRQRLREVQRNPQGPPMRPAPARPLIANQRGELDDGEV